MRAIEALERLISIGRDRHDGKSMSDIPEEEQNEVAISICQAMVNTAIPIARFRVHVVIEDVGKKSKFDVSDYTICSANTNGLKAALYSLWSEDLTVDVSLWEQRPTGADMLAGYRGKTKDQKFRRFYSQIDYFQTEPTVQ